MGRIKSFKSFCEQCGRDAVMDGRTGAAANYRKACSKVEAFQAGRNLPITGIDAEWVKAFNEWLVENACSKTTISFYNRNVRAIYNQAVRKGLIRNSHPFDEVYTKSPVSHNPMSIESEEGERIPFESLSRDELLRRYKSLASKYNNIVHRLREIMPA